MPEDQLNLPPPGCPNNGVCLTVIPRLGVAEKDIASLKVSAAKTDKMETILFERDKTADKIWKATLALILLSIANFCTFLSWRGTVDEKLVEFEKTDARHEVLLREERVWVEKVLHPSQP